jgi:SAM-dependent methyltransferase
VKDRYPMFRDGFDIIWENTTFQMYGNYRDQQIAYVKRLLKKDGLMIFLEKMNHPCPNEYARRERIKDDLFKSRYFTAEEIARKRVDIIDIMERGQVTLDSFTKSAMEQFKHVHVLWNSLNFYHVVATDSADTLAAFISKLEAPFIPSEFDCEALSCNPCESVARD